MGIARQSGRDADRAGQRLAIEDFTAAAVYRRVRHDAWQHPLTIVPAAVAVVGLLASTVLGTLAAGLVGVASGAVAALSFLYRYGVRGEEAARDHAQHMYRAYEAANQQRVVAVRDEFARAGFGDGVGVADRLDAAYRRLRASLDGSSSMSAKQFLILANSAFKEGLTLLTALRAVHGVLDGIDVDRVARERAVWEDELGVLESGGGREHPAAETLRVRIEQHRRLEALYRDRETELHKLLAQCHEVEGALHRAYLQSADLAGSGMPLATGEAAAELERAVDSARRVERRLRALGDRRARDEEEQAYLDAARRSRSAGG